MLEQNEEIYEMLTAVVTMDKYLSFCQIMTCVFLRGQGPGFLSGEYCYIHRIDT